VKIAPVPDCPACERARLITDDMRDAVALALAAEVNGPGSDARGWFRNEDQVTEFYEQADAVLAALDVPSLRARWVAEALNKAANEWNPAVLDDSGNSIAETLRELAAEYRDGTR
jgi:malic enzyme